MHWGELELQNVIRNNLRFTLEVNIGSYIATTVQLNFEAICSRYYNAVKWKGSTWKGKRTLKNSVKVVISKNLYFL